MKYGAGGGAASEGRVELVASGLLGKSICICLYVHICLYIHTHLLMPSAPRHSAAFPAACFYLAALGRAGSFTAAFGLSGAGSVVGLVAPGPVGS